MERTHTLYMPGKKIALSRPDPGRETLIASSADKIFQLAFPLQAAEMTADGQNLVFTFPDGGIIILVGFFEGGADNLPRIESFDGGELSGRAFIETYEPQLMAAVFGAESPVGSGEAAYQDDPGNLLAGIDRLGKLGTDHWGRETTQNEIFQTIQTPQQGPVILPGRLVMSLQMREDGEPDQNHVVPGTDPLTGPKDTITEDGYDESTGMPLNLNLQGAAPGISVYSITISSLPDPSQGVLFYDGKALALGQVIDNPDLTAFSFKSAGNFSGDVEFNFSYILTSPSTGPADQAQNGMVVIHVDSVADLPDASSEGTGRIEDGNHDLTAGPVELDNGWAVQVADKETYVNLSFTIKVIFGDLDGSEKGFIDVKLPEGFTVPENSGYEILREAGGAYARIPVPELGLLKDTLGAMEVPVTITMGPNAKPTGNTFEIRVIAVERDNLDKDGHTVLDNSAVRVIEQDISAAVFPGDLTVHVGWAYEGDKYGGDATADLTTIGIDPDSTTHQGAPIRFDFAGGPVTGAVITLNPAAGTLYLDGSPAPGVNGVYTFTAGDLSKHTITFMPAPGFTDKDVPLQYAVSVEDKSGNQFTISGNTFAVMDAVADVATSLAPSGISRGSGINVTITAAFADNDGSERHFVLVEKKDGWTTTDPHEVITVYFGADGKPLQPHGVDASGHCTYDLTQAVSSKDFFKVDVTAQAADGAPHGYVVHMQTTGSSGGLALMTGTLTEEIYPILSGHEYDVRNNQAFTFDQVQVALPGQLTASLSMFEDGQPGQYHVTAGADPATGPKDTTRESGYDPATGMPVTFTLSGSTADVSVQNLTIGQLPPANQGVLYYKGTAVTAGQIINSPDLEGFSFKPAPNFSGDVNFNFTYNLTSSQTGPSFFPSTGTAAMHVDSVADLPDAGSEATGRMAEGNDLTAGAAQIQDDGWFTQMVSGEPPFNITFTVKAAFGDLDGSEKGYIDVKLPAGFSIPQGSDYETIRVGNDTYARIPVPALAGLKSVNGVVEVPVSLLMGANASPTGNVFEIRVIAQEQDRLDSNGHIISDNTAIRVINQDVTAAVFPGNLTVSAGWAYEGGKSDGTATGDLSTLGLDPSSTTPDGAPIKFDFAGGTFTGGTVTINPAAGVLYLDGAPATGSNGVYTFTADQLTNHAITFMPAPGYTDKDVDVSYKLIVEDNNGNNFSISGNTTVVMDAVADAGSIAAPVSATAEADNSTLDITVNTTFADVDGSERHFILVEKQDGWISLDPHGVITVYYGADGKPLQPNGVNASGQYTYDTASAASSKDFFKIDVTDQSAQANGAAHDYVVHMRPNFSAGDATLTTGTLAEEVYADRSGYEHDVANNQAFVFQDVSVNLVGSAGAFIPLFAYEDHNPNQYVGGTAQTTADGNMIAGVLGDGDVINTTAGTTFTMTFSYFGSGVPGTFLYNGMTYSLGDPEYTQVGDHSYRLALPTDTLAQGAISLLMRYNPQPNDDTDLLNIAYRLPVVAPGTGYTGIVTTTLGHLVVDAIADKPAGVGGSMDYGTGDSAAISGSTADMAMQVRFGDYLDGSERHYLVLDLGSGLASVDTSSFPAGYDWHVMNGVEVMSAGLTAYTDGTRYAVIEVPNGYLQAHGGVFNETIKVTLDSVSSDQTTSINFIAVAVDVPSDGSDVADFNNYAETPGSVSVTIHTVTSNPELKAGMAYEDDMRLEHIGQDGSNGAPLSIGGMHASENLTDAVITFDADKGSLFYNGSPITPGSLDLGSGMTLTLELLNGHYVLSITGGSQTVDIAPEVGKLTFVPADNFSDQDVPLTFTGSVVDKASGMTKDFAPQNVTVVVDAVAQQPWNAEAEADYDDGRTAAYDTLTVTATATFRDVADGTERHYLLIEAKSYINTSGLSTTNVGFDPGGNPLTPEIGPNGLITGYLNPNPGSGTDIRVLPDHITAFIQIPVYAVLAQYDVSAGGAQTFGDFTVSREADGSFTVSYTAHLPVNSGAISSDITGDALRTGALSYEDATPIAGDDSGGKEGYIYNNAGYDFTSVPVNIAVVETRSVTLLMGSASEENAPHANVGDYTQANGAGILVVRETPDGGDYSDEQVTITFTYNSLYKDDGGNWVSPGTIQYNGVNAVTSVHPATGLVTATVVVDTSDLASILDKTAISSDPVLRADQINGSGIRFIPSSDTFNEADVNLRYTTSVQDTSSGASLGMGGGTGAVVIDAVADLPIISNTAWQYENQGNTASASPDATLAFDVTFPDTGTNGVLSEGQYILVQQITGMDLSEAFKDAVAQAGFRIDNYPDGNELYYRIPAAFFTEDPAGSHTYKVSLPLEVRGSISDTTNFDTPDILALAVVESSHGGEITASNNSARAQVTPPPLDFAVVDSTISGGSSAVYEDDTPDAYLGVNIPAGGVSFGLGLTIGGSLGGLSEEPVGNIAVHYKDTNSTLYYKVPATDGSGTFTLEPVADGGQIPPAYANSLQFIPRDPGNSTADEDININYSLTMRDPASGAEKTLSGSYLIIVDAVAEKPLNVSVDNVTYGDSDSDGFIGHNETVSMDISANFPSFDKTAGGHSDHYILVQKPGEYWTIDAPGADTIIHNGVTYFRIPVDPSLFDGSGNMTLTVTLQSPASGYLLYDNAAPILIGALAVDRDPSKSPTGDQGITYENNYAYADTQPVQLDYAPGEYDYFTVDPLYENNEPYANQFNPDGSPNSTEGGGTVRLGATIQVPDGSGGTTVKTVDSVDLTWDSSKGDLYIDGVKIDAPGSYTLSSSDLGKNIQFKTPDNYSDTDFGTVTATVHTTDGDTYTDTASPVVDAVAQVPMDLSATLNYGNNPDGTPYTATPPGGIVFINVNVTFSDFDSSESHYVLVEAKPGWTNATYPVIQGSNGVTYYRIPVNSGAIDPVTGEAHVIATILTPTDASSNVPHTLKVGAMTEDYPSDQEVRDDNNVSYNLGGEVNVVISTAESNPVLHVGNAYAGGDRDGDGMPDAADSSNIYITGLNSGSDTISRVELTFNSDHGELQYNGQPLAGLSGVTVTDMGNGTSKATITDSGIINALTSGGASSSQVQYVPTDYSPDDVSVTASITVSDLFSVDSKVVGNSGTIIVDAVAQHPDDVSISILTPNGGTAVQPGDSVPVSVTASFPDLGDPSGNSNHYMAIQQIDGWTLDGPMPEGVIIASYNNVPYYLISVDMYGEGGSPALVKNSDGSYTFDLNLKAPDSTHDIQNAAGIQGGAVVVADDGGSQELNFTNNVSVVAKEAQLNIGLVETTTANFVFGPITENSASGSPISLDQTGKANLTANNEKITDTTLTFEGDFTGKSPGDTVGTIIYDGKAYTVTVTDGGKATATVNFGSAGYDDAKDFTVVWGAVQTNPDGAVQFDGHGDPIVTAWNHTGDNMTVQAESTVVDKASGATDTASGSSNAIFTPTPNAPSGVNATDPDKASGAGEQVTFTVSGTFADIDGSEQHYFLVEQQAGWTGNYSTISLGGRTYFMVPIDSTEPTPYATVTLTTPTDLTADGSTTLRVGGFTTDGSASSASFSGGSTTIDFGVVSATGVTMTMDNTSEDAHTQMRFSLDGGDNDAITSITVTDLHGGVIVDSAGRVLFTGSPASLDVQTALNGGYYYLPPANSSGTIEVDFQAVVTDQASGASMNFATGQSSVDVAPVTDIPTAQVGTDGSPVFEPGHTASVPIHLQSDFADNDGSESHFFLVTLPDGLSVPSGWTQVTDSGLLAAAGLTGQTVYRIEADASGAASFDVSLPEHYSGGSVGFVTGAVELDNLAQGTPDYQFAAHDTVDLPSTGDINLPPAAQTLMENAGGLSGTELSGALALSDPDGDHVIISGVSSNGHPGVPGSDGSYTVSGAYGDFVVNPDGTYTYNLSQPDATGQDVLEITLADQFGATNVSSVSVNVTPVSETNPLAATFFGSYLISDGLDGDTVSSTLVDIDSNENEINFSALPVVSGDAAMPGVAGTDDSASVLNIDADVDAAANADAGAIHTFNAAETPLDTSQEAMVSFELNQPLSSEEEGAETIAEIKLDFGG